MRAYTHIAFSITLSVLLLSKISVANGVLFILIAIIFSLVPDVDTSKSLLGKKLKPISNLFELALKHRGMLHSIWALIFFSWMAYIILQDLWPAVFVGFGSHLIADSLTPRGIRLFSPLPFKMKGPIKTGSLLETSILTGLILFSLYYILTSGF